MNRTFEVYENLLLKKLDGVKEMHSLTLVWYKLLEEDKVFEVKEQIEKRGLLIDEAVKIDNVIENEYKDFALDSNQKEKIDRINDEIARLKKEMREEDEKVKKLFEAKMNDVKEELKEVRMEKKRTIGYGNLDYSYGSMYFNKLK